MSIVNMTFIQKLLIIQSHVKVFSSRHSFALYCASELCKSPVLSKMYKKRFKEAKLDCEIRGKKFSFDDFVIKYYLFYQGIGKPKDDPGNEML